MARARTESEPAVEPEAPPEEAIEEVPIHLALSRVMGDVQSVGKGQTNTQQHYNFRGIDAVVNAVGPALRKHGVVVVPVATAIEEERFATRTGAQMKGVRLTVTFRFYGPMGDFIEAQAVGEAADAGDKATPKAHSVAFRTMLLQALCIPTDEPDPDSHSYERGATQERTTRPAAARPQSQGDGWVGPKSWGDLAGRFAELIGKDESVEWIVQASEVTFGNRTPISEMPEADQRAVWEVLTKVLHDLDSTKADLREFPTDDVRETIATVFAKHLDGAVLAGPRWALTADEAERDYPAKEDIAGLDGDLTPEADDDEVGGPEPGFEYGD